MRLFFCALLSFVVVSSDAFVFYQPSPGSVAKWNVNSSLVKPSTVNPTTKAFRYYIAADAYSAANRTNEINAIRASFDQWQAISGTTVKFEYMGLINPDGLDARYDNTNVVFWTKKSLKVAAGTQDMTGRRALTIPTLALDGSILDADIVLNGIQYQWFTDANDTINQAQFVESILLHEIGHFLGLDHSTAGGATVIDGGNGINTNSGLSADEIAAARYLYPDGTTTRANIRGTVKMNGAGILGAAVIAEDAAGNIAGATITQASGTYAIYSLGAGTYKLRVTPLDPASSGNNSLLRGAEVAVDYINAVTAFQPTTNLPVTLQSGEAKTQDVNVTAGNPAFRITSISKPATQSDIVTVQRFAASLVQGQSNYFIGVNSPGFQQGATLTISGDGVTVGPTTFYANRVAQGLHSLVAPISISSNATPGLRTLMVSFNGGLAYANGYLDIASAVQDENFDTLDDRFQRKYWKIWTTSDAAPNADPDKDGLSNRYEFRTSTDPTNALSYSLILDQPARGRFGPQLSWVSDPGKRYQIYSRPSLAAPWQPLGEPITVQSDIWSIPIGFDGPGQLYRLELKK